MRRRELDRDLRRGVIRLGAQALAISSPALRASALASIGAMSFLQPNFSSSLVNFRADTKLRVFSLCNTGYSRDVNTGRMKRNLARFPQAAHLMEHGRGWNP